MKLVMTALAEGEPEVLDAQLAYHLHGGVDLVLVPEEAAGDEIGELLSWYERQGVVRRVQLGDERPADARRTRLARMAAAEHGAAWVLGVAAGEFWWPRGGSFKDVLGPIPSRYAIVQGLVRPFPYVDGTEPFQERMTTRGSLVDAPAPERPLTGLLRPVHRADPDVAVRADGTVAVTRGVPLRAWYPFEVFRFPPERAEAEKEAMATDALVEDTRLRDTLRTLRDPAVEGPSRYIPAGGERSQLSFPAPDIVDEAAYAVECAAVGEVGLARLEAEVVELEQRVAWLEERLWPRLLRLGSRVLRRN